jgi:hypothetical protein
LGNLLNSLLCVSPQVEAQAETDLRHERIAGAHSVFERLAGPPQGEAVDSLGAIATVLRHPLLEEAVRPLCYCLPFLVDRQGVA